MGHDLAPRLYRRDHRLGLVMGAGGGGKQQRAVGDRLLDGVEQLGLLQNLVGAGRRALRAMFGQPSRGLTIRKRDSAKLPIARAAMPIFSPSCGSTRITTGPAKSKPDLVLSVPEPDICDFTF